MNIFDFTRALHQIKYAGWLERLSGVIFGRSTAITTEDERRQHLATIEKLFSNYYYPVIFDADIGHMPPQLNIINGSYCDILFDGKQAYVTQHLIQRRLNAFHASEQPYNCYFLNSRRTNRTISDKSDSWPPALGLAIQQFSNQHLTEHKLLGSILITFGIATRLRQGGRCARAEEQKRGLKTTIDELTPHLTAGPTHASLYVGYNVIKWKRS